MIYLLLLISIFLSLSLFSCLKFKKKPKSSNSQNDATAQEGTKTSSDQAQPGIAVKTCEDTAVKSTQDSGHAASTGPKMTDTNECKQESQQSQQQNDNKVYEFRLQTNQVSLFYDINTMDGVSDLPSGSTKTKTKSRKTAKSDKFKKAKPKDPSKASEDDPTLAHSSRFPSDILED